MCERNGSRKQKILMPMGMLCLAAGLMLPMIVHPSSQGWQNFAHALSGFAVGLSIVFNLAAVWIRGRQRRCG